MKFHLRRVIGDQKLSYEEFSTLLSEIEACLNSRPLYPMSDDSNDPLPLTPGHFLISEPLTVVLNLQCLIIKAASLDTLYCSHYVIHFGEGGGLNIFITYKV